MVKVQKNPRIQCVISDLLLSTPAPGLLILHSRDLLSVSQVSFGDGLASFSQWDSRRELGAMSLRDHRVS